MSLRALLSFGLFVALVAPDVAAQPKRGKPAPAVAAKPAVAPAAKAPAGQPATRPAPEEKEAKDKAPSPEPVTTELKDTDSELGPAPTTVAGDSASKLSPLTPAADEFAKGPPPVAPADLDRLLGDIAALRARVSALTTTLFKSKLRVVVETNASDARIEALAITLDDGVVFVAPERFSAEDERVVYEHALAPGQHVLGVDIERYDGRSRQYRTWQNSRFTVVIPESQLVETHIRIGDSSDMAVDFPDDKDGEYDLRVRLRARVTER